MLRGGTGIFFFPIGTTGVTQTGFSQTTQLAATNDSYLTPYATLANPFPDGILLPGSSLNGSTIARSLLLVAFPDLPAYRRTPETTAAPPSAIS